jgi:type III secretion protein J
MTTDLIRKYTSLGLFLILALFFLTGCESRKTIVHSLDEKEANDIIVFLDNKGIEAYKVQAKETGAAGTAKEVFWDIDVEASRATEAMAALNSAGLPRRRGQSLLTLFSKGGLVPSEMEEKIRYQAGLGEQIANVIRKIDGVLDADVQISLPEENPLNPNAPKQKVTASVYVKHTGVLDDPNSQLIPKIRRLVSSSIPGLDYDNVTVIGDRARFSEIPFYTTTSASDEKDYVRVWTMVIAKESLLRFRIVFFSFCLALLILILALVWVSWKFYPVITQLGGFKSLLDVHPVRPETLKALSTSSEAAKEKPSEPPPEDKSDEVT